MPIRSDRLAEELGADVVKTEEKKIKGSGRKFLKVLKLGRRAGNNFVVHHLWCQQKMGIVLRGAQLKNKVGKTEKKWGPPCPISVNSSRAVIEHISHTFILYSPSVC